jgi:hypothetical protein
MTHSLPLTFLLKLRRLRWTPLITKYLILLFSLSTSPL